MLLMQSVTEVSLQPVKVEIDVIYKEPNII